MSVRPGLITVICLLSIGLPARALETDQFTVPPAPLVDISTQFQQHVTAVLQGVVSRADIRFIEESRAAARSSPGYWRNLHAQRAARCLTDDYVADALYDEAGHGLPECTIEKWVAHSRFPVERARFDPSLGESIYGASPFGRPLVLVELSPTVNLFGVYLGTDKVGHLFQQGHEYYQEYRKAEIEGKDARTATARAVDIGRDEETGIYGLMFVGVYSNGDLSANFAGLKFYLNLFRPVVIDRKTRPPILIKRQGLWEINPAAGTDYLRPFFTNHMNESLNPSRYTEQLRRTVRERFPERAARWVDFYHSSRVGELERLSSLATWYGEDYGHSSFRNVESVVDLYFDRAPMARK